jgi:hypothetical protein
MEAVMDKYNLNIIGEPIEFGNIIFLDNYKLYNNTHFPNSYKEFIKKYGYGITLGQFYIYIPMDDYGDSWNIRTEEIKNTYYNDIQNNNIWFDLEPDCDIEIIKRLIPFSASENGYYLFWDPEDKNGKELKIYITDFRTGFRKIGNTLYEIIEKMINIKYLKEILPFAKEPLPNIFKCLIKK